MEEGMRMQALAFEQEISDHAIEGLQITLRDIGTHGTDPMALYVMLADLGTEWDLSAIAELPKNDRRLFVAAASIGLDMIIGAMSKFAREAMGGA